MAEAMGRFGGIRGFANPAKKPVDRFAEYIQSGTCVPRCNGNPRQGALLTMASSANPWCAGEPDPSKGKDEIPDHTHAYGDDPVATISEVREEESAHKTKV